jgi:hypothetical protein
MIPPAIADARSDQGGPLRPLAARVIRWRVMQSADLKVDEAVIEVEADGGTWRLAHIFRHPDERPKGRPPEGWRLSIIRDAPPETYTELRDYQHSPSPSDVESFLHATQWGDVDRRFRVIAGDGK